MDEEVDKIPEFLNMQERVSLYCFRYFNFLRCSNMGKRYSWYFFMWNGNILKEFNGTNESAYDPESLANPLTLNSINSL